MLAENMLVTKGFAGMGNRIFSLLNSILYAKIMGIELYVDWKDIFYSDGKENIFPKLFKLKGIREAEKIEDTNSVYPLIWKGNASKTISEFIKELDDYKYLGSPHYLEKYSINLEKTYSEKLLFFCSYTAQIDKLEKHLENTEFYGVIWEKILKLTYERYLELDDTIKKEIADFKQKNFRKPTIGVHIRFTDLKLDIYRYKRAIDYIAGTIQDYTIFLATDNKKVEKYFKKKYKNTVSIEKWYPSDRSGLKRLHENEECKDKLKNAFNSLKDIHLLSECDYLIYSESSSFSRLARIISDISDSNTIEINRFENTPELKKLDKFPETIKGKAFNQYFKLRMIFLIL